MCIRDRYKIYHTRWWDYSDFPFNIGGYICLEFCLLWGVGTLVDVYKRQVQGVVLQPVLVGKGKGVVVVGVVVGTAVQPGALAAPCGVGLCLLYTSRCV